ncbi:MAG: bacteriocin [Nanoarchaeota archaeon]|nr:bacteriocin [Nanoarchaeota archaeon]
MLKVIRSPARRIDFKKEKFIEPARGQRVLKDVAKFENAKRVDERLKALESAGEIVEKIQEEIDARVGSIEEREKLLIKKEKELGKMAELWASLNNLDLKELNKEDLKNIVGGQKGFVKELIESYIESSGREKELIDKIEKLREKPWMGKGSSEVVRENEDLKARNKELGAEIDRVLEEIEKMQSEN